MGVEDGRDSYQPATGARDEAGAAAGRDCADWHGWRQCNSDRGDQRNDRSNEEPFHVYLPREAHAAEEPLPYTAMSTAAQQTNDVGPVLPSPVRRGSLDRGRGWLSTGTSRRDDRRCAVAPFPV